MHALLAIGEIEPVKPASGLFTFTPGIGIQKDLDRGVPAPYGSGFGVLTNVCTSGCWNFRCAAFEVGHKLHGGKSDL